VNPMSDYVRDLHANGVHVHCRPADVWLKSISKRVGDGTPRKCVMWGKVERLHSHDFDGPLACGCGEDVLG
jgi:hypothetical protein